MQQADLYYTQYAMLLHHNIEIILWPQIMVTIPPYLYVEKLGGVIIVENSGNIHLQLGNLDFIANVNKLSVKWQKEHPTTSSQLQKGLKLTVLHFRISCFTIFMK